MSIDLNLFNYWQLCCIFNETNNDVQIFLWIGRNHNDFNIAENSYYHSWLATFLSPMLTCYFKNEVIPETHGVDYIKYRSTLSLLFQGHDTTACGLQGYHLPSNQCFSTDMAYWVHCLSSSLYVPFVANFSGLSILIAPSVFSNVYLSWARNFQFLNNVIYRSSCKHLRHR
jgi:hypothetical protein